ncbi:2-dehydropantoate 2-reductase [Piscinibacter sp. XHJ-5]|uniref:2-dehydropantoate 2-reductase n=1 Tax=Piscinibacter sp. XHJ-5 TaxID=3037797 RepID=UPI002452E2C6|nr:2-dehydropantoate 2-reductase [Piscinibacter sp. XHJ-5]
MTRVCIAGVGAIGGLFGAWLGRMPDVDLSALARGRTLEVLRRDGLQLESAGSTQRVALRASDDPRELGEQDLVIVAVKGPALASVASKVAGLLGPQTPVLVAMNGVPWWFFDGLPGECHGLRLESVDPGGVVRAAIPAERVIGCVVHAASAATAPGVVRHAMGNGLIIGEPRGGTSARLEQLTALLARAGFAVTASERIQRDIWFKLWGNMTMNPMSALTGATMDRLLDDPLVRSYASAVMLEAREIGARIGCPIDQTPEQRHEVTRKLGAVKTSMLQDVEAGRPLELAALVGAVKEIAGHLRIPTPHLDGLLGLARVMAQARGLT